MWVFTKRKKITAELLSDTSLKNTDKGNSSINLSYCSIVSKPSTCAVINLSGSWKLKKGRKSSGPWEVKSKNHDLKADGGKQHQSIKNLTAGKLLKYLNDLRVTSGTFRLPFFCFFVLAANWKKRVIFFWGAVYKTKQPCCLVLSHLRPVPQLRSAWCKN